MSQGKITFTLGSLSFSGEGEEKWLAEQLQIIVKAVPTLGAVATAAKKENAASSRAENGESSGQEPGTLAARIKAARAESNQNKRFLATAYASQVFPAKEMTESLRGSNMIFGFASQCCPPESRLSEATTSSRTPPTALTQAIPRVISDPPASFDA